MAYSNIVLQPALHVWTCLNVYIVKYTFPWNQDLAINAPQVIPQISSLLHQRITLISTSKKWEEQRVNLGISVI